MNRQILLVRAVRYGRVAESHVGCPNQTPKAPVSGPRAFLGCLAMSVRERWRVARQAILGDTNKVFREEPSWRTEGRTLRLRAPVSHSTPLAVELDVLGQASVFGEKLSISLRANERVQLMRLCSRYGDHDIAGWHGLWLPEDGKQPPHDPDPSLTGISRPDALGIFCQRVAIEMPEQLQIPWPEGADDGL